jgi:hypothetical protein
MSVRPPLAWELELMEGCLRAVPDFVSRHKQDDSAREEFTVPAALGELKLGLSWVVEAVAEEQHQEQDYLLDVVHEQWNNILFANKQYEGRKPIVLYDIQEKRVYVYEYEGFKSELNPRNQEGLAEQYEQALRENKIVVFVRDNEQRRLASFSMNYK